MKKYAIAVDVSPSEQINESDESIFCIGILFGLKARDSFDQVGYQHPKKSDRLKLRKYSKANSAYKARIENYFRALRLSKHVVAGVSIVNQYSIKRFGLPVWEKAHGKLPKPIDLSKSGKKRYLLGEYKKTDGTKVASYKVLQDDLCIIGWMASEFAFIHQSLCKINKEIVTLDVLMDRMPNDQGPTGTNKAELLKWTIEKLSGSVITVIGIPDQSDHHQRDLLVDNIAGYCSEKMREDPKNGRRKIEELFGMTRFRIEKP